MRLRIATPRTRRTRLGLVAFSGLLALGVPLAPASADPGAQPDHSAARALPRSPAVRAVHAAEAWRVTRGAGIVVAVIDSGVAGNTTNLAGRVLDGVDLFNPERPRGWHDPVSFGGHGTGVASIIAGNGTGNGVFGIAPQATILPVRVASANGSSPDPRIARAIDWSVAHDADVINISMGDIKPSRAIHTAIRRAVRRGVPVITGAGNDGPRNTKPFYPASYPEAIAVAATRTISGDPANFSMRGDWVDLSAPGTMVWNTNNDGTLGKADGTSFSAPAVAGAVALMLSVNPTLTPAHLRRILMDTATDTAAPGFDVETGAGILHVAAAVRAAAAARNRPNGR